MIDTIKRNEIVSILQSCIFFKGFSNEELSTLSSIGSLRSFKKDEIIFSENQFANEFYILHKGSVNLIFSSKKIIKIAPYQIFGDWAVVNNTVRLATAVSKDHTVVVALNADQLKNPANEFSLLALKLVLQIAKGLVDRLQSQSQISSKILIESGESDQVEFKSTLRLNLHTSKFDVAIENSVIKTIAAFLNSKGGVLFIGINDSGQILGTDNDKFENDDKMLQHLVHIITARIGKSVVKDIHPVILKIEGRSIVRVDVEPSTEAVFVRDGNQELFYVRDGVSTNAYSIREAITYVSKRF